MAVAVALLSCSIPGTVALPCPARLPLSLSLLPRHPPPTNPSATMSKDTNMTAAVTTTPQDVKADDVQQTPAPAPPSVQADIEHNLSLLRSAVTILEPRLTTKVLRTLQSIRKRLDDGVLVEAIEKAFPAGACPSPSVGRVH